MFIMAEKNLKEVLYCSYCTSCEYYKISEHMYPCNDCLGHSANENTHKPIRFKVKEKNK